jgi:CHAD domain-containing protein
VSDRLAEFVLEGNGGSPSATVAAALRARFAVADAEPRTVRRLRLDTFDWRLHRAGLVLEQISDQRSELALSAYDGERIVMQPAMAKWPSLLDALSASGLRDRLAPIVGVRALLPLAETEASVCDLRLLNGDQKTVVRVRVEEAVLTAPVAAALSTRVVLVPVRGYPRQAERAARVLAATPGFRRARQSRLDAELAAAGRQAGDYTGRVEVHLDASSPATLSVAVVLLHLLDTLEANLDGVQGDLDTEFLHDLRVAVRRTRSALKLAGDALPAGLAERFAPDFKWLGDLTTPVRDLDVYLLGLTGEEDGLDATGLPGLAPFQGYLTRRRRTEMVRLLDGLRSARFTTLAQDWRAALAEASISRRGGAVTGPGTGELAASRIKRTHRRVIKRGSAITPDSPATDLHDLRKRCKELRYLLEFFASLHDRQIHRRMVKELKSLQDCLGEFQDSQVQREAINAFAEQMLADGAPAATLLTMGALATRLDGRQRRARGEFADIFSRFSNRRNTQRISVLTEAART